MCEPHGWFQWAEGLTTFVFAIVGVLAIYGWLRGDIGRKQP